MNEAGKEKVKIAVIVLLDLLLLVGCGGMALLVRYDFSFMDIPVDFRDDLVTFLGIQAVLTVAVFWLRGMYRYVWRAVSVQDVVDMIVSVTLAYGISLIASGFFDITLPRSSLFIDALCLIIAQVGMRCVLRFYSVLSHAMDPGGERIMLIGGGDAGRMLLGEMATSNKIRGKVWCIIDDNSAKWGKRMNGVPIVGGRDKIVETAAAMRISQIIFAIPSIKRSERKKILELCQQTNCRVRMLPGVYQMVSGEASLSDVRDVQVEDLLGRDSVKLDTRSIEGFLGGRTVLVTGGGGSIGSELCRQIARYAPKKLIILDIYENNAYDIQQELTRKYPSLTLCTEIASVRDKEKIYELFDRYRPEVVFHAAAHKHVPLMENAPEEAVKNNVFGTYHVVRAAEKFGAKRVVMISTDKAVNPTNTMGATKRLCEMILQSRVNSTTEFCAVRFGNVLGSNGSVVPLFKRQIEAGGPVTLTDKRIVRYFMTIPEAAQLVLEAGAMAQRGQIFVLDMGEPVKILTLAENLIRLSGLEPYRDIDIVEIGLRPGEKLYEELLVASGDLRRTANEKIFVEQQTSIDPERVMDALVRLDKAVSGEADKAALVALLKELVPTFRDPDEVNAETVSAERAAEGCLSGFRGQ
ncbi:MAG: polysaccharide biosynthesis protein [Oscillospiraceae bacterium]|nr:polysaccharide biosynthesis protein [Oscillospiraceae bacterium]